MKKIILYSSLFLLSACQPTQPSPEQQQNFVCKALIEGYLKAQQLGQFQLSEKQHNKENPVAQINYIYRQPTVNGMMLGLYKPAEIKFQCQLNGKHHYLIQWLDSNSAAIPLLSINLPQTKSINTLQASVQGTQ